MKNRNLHTAKRSKMDEFYTQLTDIEKELYHYRKHFKNKTVFCNCDDPSVSNFYLFFKLQFGVLGLKKLITTCYKNDQFDLFSKNDKDRAICHEYVETAKGIEEKEWLLKGDGDFRSEECIEILKQADIVCTNPPFSLFREYVAQLMRYDKKFLIIGNGNSITYKEIFPLIKDNSIWLGVQPTGMTFIKPDGTEQHLGFAIWFTNLPHKKRNEELILVKKYKGNEKEYPKYDKYDAIEVSKVVSIPKDYKEIMGVPITFLNKYNPSQFEIIGLIYSSSYDAKTTVIPFLGKGNARAIVKGKPRYPRLLIKRR